MSQSTALADSEIAEFESLSLKKISRRASMLEKEIKKIELKMGSVNKEKFKLHDLEALTDTLKNLEQMTAGKWGIKSSLKSVLSKLIKKVNIFSQPKDSDLSSVLRLRTDISTQLDKTDDALRKLSVIDKAMKENKVRGCVSSIKNKISAHTKSANLEFEASSVLPLEKIKLAVALLEKLKNKILKKYKPDEIQDRNIAGASLLAEDIEAIEKAASGQSFSKNIFQKLTAFTVRIFFIFQISQIQFSTVSKVFNFMEQTLDQVHRNNLALKNLSASIEQLSFEEIQLLDQAKIAELIEFFLVKDESELCGELLDLGVVVIG